MILDRKILIDLCDKFSEDKIDKSVLLEFAWNAITNYSSDLEKDETISDIIYEWDNEEMDFPINKINIELWKKRLLTEQNDLLEYNNWNTHIARQKEICLKYDSKWDPINKKLNVGVSANLESDPINGLRHSAEKGTTGWFIWTGEYSERDDFFQPICAEHLLQIRPEIIKYLGLESGFRFLCDKKGYEDIWRDEKLNGI